MAFKDANAVPPRGVTKVERLNLVRNSQASAFVVTPEWDRKRRHVEEGLRPVTPPLESRRKAKEAKPEEETLTATPTLPTGQPRMRGVNVLLKVLAMIGCLHVFIMLGIELNRMVATQQQITRLTLETQSLEREVSGLQLELDNANNPKFREQLARRAGFAYPDEARWLSQPGTDPNQP
jgi:cell division protein FtsB